MTFVDEIKVHISAGAGGHGVVRWRHEKGRDKAGAAGGNGGFGGDVYVRAVRNLNILAQYRHIKEFSAKRGGDGFRDSCDGKAGEDFILDLPIGSSVKNLSTGKVVNLLEDGQVIKILKGGRGGLGNEHFKASTNVRPKQSTLGKPGEEADFEIELSLVADAGLVGLPNAGKSSLLNALTNAASKVGAYAFTTIDPHLGPLFGFVLADIPGLIAGASSGKGLGYKFLRHVSRTKALMHCVSAENKNPIEDYNTVREELGKYDKSLLKKEEIILITKTDTVSVQDLKKTIDAFKKKSKIVLSVSVLDDVSLKNLSDELVKILKKL
jgi:GTP-binding protein